jgi:3-oxoacyl-[acyl-carrier-protein] synthase-3
LERRILKGEGLGTSHMGAEAVKGLLERTGNKPSDIDLLICATTTPDMVFPSTANLIADMVGLGPVGSFDVQAACSGFIYALTIASQFVANGQCKKVVVVGADKMSTIIDYTDRATCVLFGDGAGAIVLEAQETADEGGRGILTTKLHADGRHNELLYVDGGVSTTGTVGKLRMKGREVFRHAVTNLASVMTESLAMAGLDANQVDWVVPHQANARILDATARKLGLEPAKVVVTVDQHANTSAASVPLALDVAVRDGRIRQGQIVVLEAMGGGFTWGAAVIRF